VQAAVTSGVRLGTPACTTRGFGAAEFRAVGHMISDVLDGLAATGGEGDRAAEEAVGAKVRDLCERFPIYPA
jgi:glycine hydroxymethyltransferase